MIAAISAEVINLLKLVVIVLVEVKIQLLFEYHVVSLSMSHVIWWMRSPYSKVTKVIIRAKKCFITNRSKCYYKLVQLLEIKAIIVNWGIAQVILCLQFFQNFVPYWGTNEWKTSLNRVSFTKNVLVLRNRSLILCCLHRKNWELNSGNKK